MTASDRDIFRSANMYLELHGEEVTTKARDMVRAMKENGDSDGLGAHVRPMRCPDRHRLLESTLWNYPLWRRTVRTSQRVTSCDPKQAVEKQFRCTEIVRTAQE